MKRRTHIPGVVVLLAATAAFMLVPNASFAQSTTSWWGSASWFDWSDFRLEAGARLWAPRLQSGKITVGNREVSFFDDVQQNTPDPVNDPIKPAFSDDREAFKEIWGVFYIDRLGIRFHLEDQHIWRGRPAADAQHPAAEWATLSQFDVSCSRVGLDLDLVRYPFLKLGVNFDWHSESVELRKDTYNWHNNDDSHDTLVFLKSAAPLTVGVHGRAIPFRLREVPLNLRARFRFPAVLAREIQKETTTTKLYDLEMSAGMRPAVWDLSLYGLSTFSASVDVGFRWTKIHMSGPAWSWDGTPTAEHPHGVTTRLDPDADVTAEWSGPYIEFAVTY